MKNVVLIGGGGHCKSVIDVIELQGEYNIVGIVDQPRMLGEEVLGYKVIGSDSNLMDIAKQYGNAIITFGHVRNLNKRIELFNLAIESGFELPVIISPRAYVSKHSKIGKGTVIMHDALINANTIVGENCIINSKALIEHDAIIEDHCHISTASVINGGTTVKANTFYGSNATSREYMEIGGFIKAGSVVK